MRVETGIDLVEVARMEKSLASPRFWQRGFSPREREEIGARPNRAQSAAAVFAAKEVCAKAMGTGFRGIRLVEIELLHDGSGKPELHLSGAAGEFAQSSGLAFSVSLTHTRQHAAAVVVAYSDREKEQQGWKL